MVGSKPRFGRPKKTITTTDMLLKMAVRKDPFNTSKEMKEQMLELPGDIAIWAIQHLHDSFSVPKKKLWI